MELESEFDIEIEEADAVKLDTVGKALQYIEQRTAEELFSQEAEAEDTSPIVADVTLELKKYFAKHPEKLQDLDPRRFEELVADILKDFGFDTELTTISRDGGRDVYAYMRNAVTSFLLFVECKRWKPPKHVGIDIVQRMYGTSRIWQANKGMIVTTSFFTEPAKSEQKIISTQLELVDYNGLKTWLKKYG
jgi:restriction endonuclease Mrr